jgi:hypothetical protein
MIKESIAANDMQFKITKMVKSNVSVADAQSHISDISVVIEEKIDEIKVSVDHPLNNDLNYTVNFKITLPPDFDYNIDNGNGNISINATSRIAVIDLGNGNIEADMVLPDTCSVNFKIGNGSMNVSIPDNTNASLDVSAGNGGVNVSGLTIQNQQYSVKKLSGTLGTGAGSIELTVGNGSIELKSN